MSTRKDYRDAIRWNREKPLTRGMVILGVAVLVGWLLLLGLITDVPGIR